MSSSLLSRPPARLRFARRLRAMVGAPCPACLTGSSPWSWCPRT